MSRDKQTLGPCDACGNQELPFMNNLYLSCLETDCLPFSRSVLYAWKSFRIPAWSWFFPIHPKTKSNTLVSPFSTTAGSQPVELEGRNSPSHFFFQCLHLPPYSLLFPLGQNLECMVSKGSLLEDIVVDRGISSINRGLDRLKVDRSTNPSSHGD